MKHLCTRHLLSRTKVIALAALTSASAVLLPLTAHGEETDATKLLKQMSAYLAGQKTIAGSYDTSIEVVTNQLEKIQFDSSGKFTLARPDKLKVSREGGYSDIEFSFDGQTATILGKDANIFAQFSAPGSTDALLDRMRNEYGMLLPGGDLLSSDVFSVLSPDIVSERYIGTGVIGGVECDHLAFRNEDADWQLWIDKGANPLPRKLVITNRIAVGAPQYTLVFREWKTDAAVKNESFSIAPPSGATKLEMKELVQRAELDDIPAMIAAGDKQ